MTTSLENDTQYSLEMIRRHSTSFYRAFRHLEKPRAEAVYAIYAFCRQVDDLVDVSCDTASLDALEQQLDRFENGETPDGPMWRELRRVFVGYPMDIQPFRDMLAGQRMDVDFHPYENMDRLLLYCYRVAGTVGLMLLPVLAGNRREQLRESAVQLGTAMQLTNILRDIGEDLERSRVYLPLDLMQKYQVTEKELAERNLSSRFIRLWEHLADLAENLYREADTKAFAYDRKARFSVMLASAYYRGILRKIRRKGYPVLDRRIHTGTAEKLWIYFKVWLRNFLWVKSTKQGGGSL